MPNKKQVKIEVKEVDAGLWNFTESSQVGEATIAHYLYGRCNLFAVALATVFKERCRLYSVIESHTGDNPIPFLNHLYAIIDGNKMIDARGAITQSTLDEYESIAQDNVGFDCVYTEEIDIETLLKRCNDKFWGSFDKGELDTLINFIENNKEVYLFDTHLMSVSTTKFDNKQIQYNKLLNKKYGTEIEYFDERECEEEYALKSMMKSDNGCLENKKLINYIEKNISQLTDLFYHTDHVDNYYLDTEKGMDEALLFKTVLDKESNLAIETRVIAGKKTDNLIILNSHILGSTTSILTQEKITELDFKFSGKVTKHLKEIPII